MIQKWIIKELKTERIEGDPFLLINIPDHFRESPPIKKLEARLIDSNGKLVGAGTAEARMERITGLRFFANPKWYPKTTLS